MPLRSDPSLWFNLPGVVAAYQPVRAPDSLLARYNMAHGGDSRYLVQSFTADPIWAAATGWSGTWNFSTNITPSSWQWSYVVRFASCNTIYDVLFGGNLANRVTIAMNWGGGNSYFANNAGNGGQFVAIGQPASGVAAIAGKSYYINGRLINSNLAGTNPQGPIVINGWADGSTASNTILAFAICDRILTHAEVWQASRQMQYCDVNPDWSVWSPRRKWFPYVLATAAGRAGIYGARPTVALPGGVRIVPQDEGGVIDG